MAYNLPGISNLVLTRHHIVGFYNGSIRNWNDTSIQELNPDLYLPDEDIFVIARSDKSGTMYMQQVNSYCRSIYNNLESIPMIEIINLVIIKF